jgi:hypothetical protein
MKPQLLFASLAAITLLFSGCKKEDTPNELFVSSERLVGFWVPYEEITNGTVIPGPFTAASFFGVYAESVMILEDNTYIPVTVIDVADKQPRFNEMGIYDFYPLQKRLDMRGLWQVISRVEKLTDDEMWLRNDQTLRKFRKQPY